MDKNADAQGERPNYGVGKPSQQCSLNALPLNALPLSARWLRRREIKRSRFVQNASPKLR